MLPLPLLVAHLKVAQAALDDAPDARLLLRLANGRLAGVLIRLHAAARHDPVVGHAAAGDEENLMVVVVEKQKQSSG